MDGAGTHALTWGERALVEPVAPPTTIATAWGQKAAEGCGKTEHQGHLPEGQEPGYDHVLMLFLGYYKTRVF